MSQAVPQFATTAPISTNIPPNASINSQNADASNNVPSASATSNIPPFALSDFLKPHCNENSIVENLKCVGPHYAQCIHRHCSTQSIGGFVEFCSYKPLESVLRIVQSCSRNQRAGEPDSRGRTIPACNVRVWRSLMQLLWLARKRPELFPHYKVRIDIPSAIILQNLAPNI